MSSEATALGESRSGTAFSETVLDVLYALGRNADRVLSVLVLLIILGWALLPGLFTSVDPLFADTAQKLTSPSTQHIFGTDQLGRDLYSRVVYGAATSLSTAAIAVLIAVVLGALIGAIAGVSLGLVDNVLMRIIDVLLALPSLLVSLVLITALGQGPLNVAIAVGLSSVASFARVTRSEVLGVVSRPYVEASRVLGASRFSSLSRHVLPNSLQPVASLVAIELGKAVLAIAALSFLGFGVSAPDPEWGAIVSDGRNYVKTAWWITAIPSLVIALTVVSSNQVGGLLKGAK